MFSDELARAIQTQADARNEEVLVMMLQNIVPEPLFDLVGMELACEYGMARGNRKARLYRIFMEHFADRFNLEGRFGFEETGL